VRIEHIRVDGFGTLADFDTGKRRLGSLVVVLGPNEAGKSTLFSFLTTMLYGFKPASRDLSPHVPWGSDEAAGCVGLRLADGRSATIERRLRSSPSGELMVDDTTEPLRNQPAPWVDHVPRNVFRQVFAITLAELAGLDEETWARIQDRVLGSMGASDLRSAREVADALEREAGEIWRPNRRGNQRLRDLRAEIRALRARRGEAVARDREIRALVEERENVLLSLRDARQDRGRDRAVVERMTDLLPLKRQLERIESLRATGGSQAELAGLPDDPAEELARLRTARTRLRSQLQEARSGEAEPRAAIERFDARCANLLEHRSPLRTFIAAAAEAGVDRDRLDALEAEHRELEARRRSAHGVLLTSDAESTPDRVAAISVELLRDRISRFEAARHHAAEARSSLARDASVEARSRIPAIGLIGAGAALLAWGLAGSSVAVTAAGAGALAVGLTVLLLRRAPSAAKATGEAGGETEAPEAIRTEILRMLGGLPVREAFLDPPGQALAADLERLRDLVARLRDNRREAAPLRERVRAVERQADEIRSSLGRVGDEPAEVLAQVLESELHDAGRAESAARAAERELARLERSRAGLEEDLRRVDDTIEALEQAVVTAANGPIDRALAAVKRRLEAHARADRLEEELERSHPDLQDLVARIRAAEARDALWAIDEGDLAARKGRLQELEEKIELLVRRAEALERDAEHLRALETVDVVDSAVLSLQEREARLVVERDRTWVLARLIREADRRFREEHQPDVVKKASGYLRRLTGGRYERLIVDDGPDGDLFQLVGPQLPAPVPLARPISTGTLEQAYLSLRLAIVDHLDPGDERLPLFMDEAFVNWDAERRRWGIELLEEVSSVRQVFAFTCHPQMAEELGGRGACILRLDP